MKIVDGIAYGDEPLAMDPFVVSAKPGGPGTINVLYSNGEVRSFESSKISDYPVFKSLADDAVFFDFSIDHGVVTWENGKLDIAPETMFALGGEINQ